MKVTGLAMLTSYSFQIRARNPMGFGPPNEFVVKTKGPASEYFNMDSDLDCSQASIFSYYSSIA